MNWKEIKNQAYMWYYAGILLIFIFVTVWIYLVNDGNYPMEICFVRYGGALVFGILCHYIFFVRGIRPRWKIFIKIGTVLAIEGIVSALAVKVLAVAGILEGFSKRYMLLIWILLIIAFVMYLFMKQKLNDSKTLALIVFLMGTLFAFSFPATTGISWDDQIHYQRALQISRLGNTKYSKADKELIVKAYFGGAPELFQTGEYGEFQKKIGKLYKSMKKTSLSYENLQIGVAIAYLPSAIFLIIARGFSLPYVLVFLIGRWANVVLYSLLIYQALKQLKSGKLIIFMISMFPTTLFLLGNYSYDTWGIGWTILGFSYFIGVLQNESARIGYGAIIKICLLLILGYSAKPIYFCLILLLMCVKKDKLQENLSMTKYRLIVMFTTIFVMLSFVAPFLLNGAGGNDMRGGLDVDSMQQIKYILMNPLEYTHILLTFLKSYWSGYNAPYYISSFAYLGNVGSFCFIFWFSIMIIFLDKAKCDIKITVVTNRIWALFLVFSASVFVATSMYIAFTPVSAGEINGCQPRYLLPILFVTNYFIGDYRLIAPIDKFVNRKVLLMGVVLIYVTYASYGLCRLCINLY